MGIIFTPPMNIAQRNRELKTIFLAGTIDMGNSRNWQRDYAERLSRNKYNVLNPRRDDWDSTWEQTYENPHFYQQVNWELNAIDQSDIILFYIEPDSKSPITLLELGLVANSGKTIFVYCPKEFYRSGNVEIVCDRYDIPLYDSLHLLEMDLGI